MKCQIQGKAARHLLKAVMRRDPNLKIAKQLTEKAPKFGNKKTDVGGIAFDSKREATRWSELLLLQRAGHISGLQRQKSYDITVNGMLICRYICDFWYIDTETDGAVIEDAKGIKTPEYKLKKKLMLACYGIEVVEV